MPTNLPAKGDWGLTRLPEAERQAWRSLWADVQSTLTNTQVKSPPKQETIQRN